VEVNSLEDLLSEILKHRFTGNPAKQNIIPEDRGFNIACPYCGDSKKVQGKKRGHVYLDSKNYKCWNDGCFKFTTLREFVSDWINEFDLDITNLEIDFNPEVDYKKVSLSLEGNKISEYLRSEGFLDDLITIDYVIDRFSLTPIDQISKETEAYKYIESRGLYAIPNIGDTIYSDFEDKSIYIFNYDKSTSIAATGLSKVKFLLDYLDDDLLRIMYDNDPAGKKETIDAIHERKTVFLWGKLIEKLFEIFNKDYRKIKRIKDTNNLYCFLYEKTPLSIEKFNKILDKYYTNNIYDLFNI
jgi:hypothetical protein